jgi:hypothetical protein
MRGLGYGTLYPLLNRAKRIRDRSNLVSWRPCAPKNTPKRDRRGVHAHATIVEYDIDASVGRQIFMKQTL